MTGEYTSVTVSSGAALGIAGGSTLRTKELTLGVDSELRVSSAANIDVDAGGDSDAFASLPTTIVMVDGDGDGLVQVTGADGATLTAPNMADAVFATDEVVGYSQTLTVRDITMTSAAGLSFSGGQGDLSGTAAANGAGGDNLVVGPNFVATLATSWLLQGANVTLSSDTSLLCPTIDLCTGSVNATSTYLQHGTATATAYRLHLSARTAVFESGASLAADGIAGVRRTSCTNAQGCSHGGVSDGSDSDSDDARYGDPTAPSEPGSAFNTAFNRAGGVVRIDVSSTLTIASGAVVSASGVQNNQHVVSGTGGSVYITSRRLDGSGMVKADGAQSTTVERPAGAGGRVAVVVTEASSFVGTLQANGGTNHASSVYHKRPGTVYVSIPGQISDDSGDIAIPGGATFQHLYLPAIQGSGGAPVALTSITLGDGATAGFVDSLSVAGAITLGSGASLTTSSVFADGPWQLTAAAISLADGAQIGATERNLELVVTGAATVISGTAGVAVSDAGATLNIAGSLSLQDSASVTASTFVDVVTPSLTLTHSTTSIAVTKTSTGWLQVQAASCVIVGDAAAARATWRCDNMTVASGGHVNSDGLSLVSTGRPAGGLYGCSYGGVASGSTVGVYGDPQQPTDLGTAG